MEDGTLKSVVASFFSSLKSVSSALILRLFAVGISASVGLIGVAWLGADEYGFVALSLVTTGVLSSLGSGGFGRSVLRDFSNEKNPDPLSYLYSFRWQVASWLLFSCFLHIILIVVIGSISGFASDESVVLAVVGAVHSLLAGCLVIISDALRVVKKNWVADITYGRVGGAGAALVALGFLSAGRLFGVSVDSTWLLFGFVIGGGLFIAFGLFFLVAGKSLDPLPTRWKSSRERFFLASSLAVAPLTMAAPVWCATVVLSRSELGVLGLAIQMTGVLGALGYAVQSPYLASLGVADGESSPEKRESLQMVHSKVAPLLSGVVASGYIGIVGASWPLSLLLGITDFTTFFSFVVVLGIGHVWNVSMGMTGIQLQLSGRAKYVLWVGVARAVSSVLLVLLFGRSLPGFLFALLFPSMLWPLVLGWLVAKYVGVQTSIFNRFFLQKV